MVGRVQIGDTETRLGLGAGRWSYYGSWGRWPPLGVKPEESQHYPGDEAEGGQGGSRRDDRSPARERGADGRRENDSHVEWGLRRQGGCCQTTAKVVNGVVGGGASCWRQRFL